MLAPGMVLQDRYRIVRELGGGGMGRVYLAHDNRLANRPCAVKQLLPDPGLNAEEQIQAAEQFSREAGLLAHLSHRNLPEVYDHFDEGDFFYLVMEYVHGETLAERLATSSGGFSQEAVIDWGLQLCDVLAYLHAQDPPVIFRDLKPDNIMVCDDGTIKLIDFGVARFFDPAKGTDTLKMGTVGYAPPEGYAGQGQTTPRSDIYSLGVTLHELLTGDDPSLHPFIFTPPGKLKAGISTRLSAAITRAVNLDPGARFASATEMRVALQKVTQPRRLMLPGRKGPEITGDTRGAAGSGAGETPVASSPIPPRAGKRFLQGATRVLGIGLLVLLLLVLVAGIGGAFLAASFAERAIAAADWELEHSIMHSVTTESEMAAGIQPVLEPYLPNALRYVAVNFDDPNRAVVIARTESQRYALSVTLQAIQGVPVITLESFNDIPLLVVGRIISGGINRGFAEVFENSGFRVKTIKIVHNVLEIELVRR
ncbi:MAG: serine/threonine protein kinase [Anaerolineae bacterium]|nr:serine/threonine protein kinase [Anaerolineae bacterium]